MITLALKLPLLIILLNHYISGEKYEYPDNIVRLTSKNFNQLVLDSKDIWIISFYATWCAHCRKLIPEFLKVADTLEGVIKVGAIDYDKSRKLLNRLGIEEVPTVLIYPEDKSKVREYKGRNAKNFVDLALNISKGLMTWEEFDEVQEQKKNVSRMVRHDGFIQIVDIHSFVTPCDRKDLCVVGFLPKLTECAADCRNGYLQILNVTKEYFKNEKWEWLWCEVDSHVNLESYLNLERANFPAVVVYDSNRKRYALHDGNFLRGLIVKFLNDIKMGIKNTQLVGSSLLPAMNEIDPWNGKDLDVHSEL